MSHARKVFAVALLAALAWAVAPVAEAQPPIRIGASLSQTGALATLGQNTLRGYQLCVKHMSDKGGGEARPGSTARADGDSASRASARLRTLHVPSTRDRRQ